MSPTVFREGPFRFFFFSRGWEHLRSLGVRTDELRAVLGQFEKDLDPAAWGFAQLADINDEGQRAVVSDLALASALPIKTNL